MAKFCQKDLQVFTSKVVENFSVAKDLFEKQKYNASANRLYYSFVNLGCRCVAMYEDEIDGIHYLVYNSNKIDKSKIKNCAKQLKVKQYALFRIYMNQAESARIKADYSNHHVVKGEIKEIFDKFEAILKEEDIPLDKDRV